MKIYKYQLPVQRGVSEVRMEKIVRILHIEVIRVEMLGVTNDEVYMWAVVVEDSLPVDYNIDVRHDGDYDGRDYIGTAVLYSGGYVLHYFMSI